MQVNNKEVAHSMRYIYMVRRYGGYHNGAQDAFWAYNKKKAIAYAKSNKDIADIWRLPYKYVMEQRLWDIPTVIQVGEKIWSR